MSFPVPLSGAESSPVVSNFPFTEQKVLLYCFVYSFTFSAKEIDSEKLYVDMCALDLPRLCGELRPSLHERIFQQFRTVD